MTYSVKEMYYTLQGEGAQAGRAAVFLRFAGCNLWTGREQDRGKAVCSFCDTDFVGTDGPGGGAFKTAEDLAHAVEAKWPKVREAGAMSCAPAASRCLQLDTPLIEALHRLGFEVGVETNGTQAAPEGLDWICVSPKADAELKLIARQRIEAGLSAKGRAAGTLRGSGLRALLPAAAGRRQSRCQHRRRRRTIAWPIRIGG